MDAAGIDPGHIVGVAQPLPWPGKRAVQRKAAESNVRVAESDLRALRLALSATARQAYAELHYLHGALRINAEQQQRLTELQQATSGRYRAGAGSQHALLRASTRLAERRRQALEFTARRRMVEARVNAMRNRPIHSSVPRPSGWSTLPALPPIAALEGALRQSNPRLLKLQAQGRTAQLNRELAALAYKPDLRLTANYLGTLPRSEYRTQVGVMLNLPLGQSKRRARPRPPPMHESPGWRPNSGSRFSTWSRRWPSRWPPTVPPRRCCSFIEAIWCLWRVRRWRPRWPTMPAGVAM